MTPASALLAVDRPPLRDAAPAMPVRPPRLATFRRCLEILRVLLRHGAWHLAATLAAGRPRLARWLPARLAGPVEVQADGPARLRLLFEDLGGTFIKFGQMLALQPDILSLRYCNALFNLMDRIAPFPWADAEAILTAELGRPPDEVFADLDRRPMATASIGQVYSAWYRGRRVAVKVRRPDVEVDFAGDVQLMRGAVRTIRALRLGALYWLIEPMTEFVGWTMEELDYRNEARYMTRLRSNAADNPAEAVPAVYWELTSRRTLVVDFLEGVTLLDYLRAREAGGEHVVARLGRDGFEPTTFARNVIDNFLGDAFRHGMFHADLHPANLMILPGNVVGYVDFGITGILSPYSRRHLVAMTLAYTQGDLGAMAEHFFKVSTVTATSDLAAFRRGMLGLADEWYEGQGSERRLRKNFTLVMLDMLTLSRATGILPERDVIKYIRSAIAIDGLITRFAPGFSVGRYLETVCRRHLRWSALGSAVSYHRLLAWSGAGGRLASDGAARAATVFDRLAAGDFPVTARLMASGGDGEPGRRAVELAAGVLLVAFLAWSGTGPGGAPPTIGWNVFTVEAGLAIAGLLLLVPALRRLS